MNKMSLGVRIKLSAMMFLQFMLCPVWFIPLAVYAQNQGIKGSNLWLIMSAMPIGCLFSPIVGMIADRHFASQKVLAVLNFICAGALVLAVQVSNPVLLFLVLLLAMLCYMPTWGLTSAIAMSNSPSDKFPQIRVFGSVGWVASGIFSFAAIKLFKISQFDGTELPLYCGAAISLIAGFAAFFIPNTPPPAKGQKASVVDALGLRSFALLKDFHFAVFIIISMLVMVPFSIYWTYGSVFLEDKGFEYITATMNLGQLAEMGFMLLIPLALARMGVKWAMLIGLVALMVRYVAFWLGGVHDMQFLYFIAILVHGLIFGFFFVGGQIFIDKFASKELKAQAQGFIFLVTFGIGLLIGNFFNGDLIQRNSQTAYVPVSLIEAEVIVAKSDLKKGTPEEIAKKAKAIAVTKIKENADTLKDQGVVLVAAGAETDKIEASVKDGSMKKMTIYGWDNIWMVNTVISVVLLLAFFALFRDKTKKAETEEEIAELEHEAEAVVEV